MRVLHPSKCTPFNSCIEGATNVMSKKSRMHTLDCAICSKSITLEECKIDERGRAVHYQCLADKMERQESETNPKPN